MLRVIKQNLLRAQQRMKYQVDKHRSDRTFQVGDMVYLRLQPYIQTSVATRANHKLAYKYFRPFEVLQHIGTIAYKLKLPATASVHPVFHVSQLKQSVKSSCPVSVSLPTMDAYVRYPVQVLQRHSILCGGHPVAQVLIKWSGCDDALNS